MDGENSPIRLIYEENLFKLKELTDLFQKDEIEPALQIRRYGYTAKLSIRFALI